MKTRAITLLLAIFVVTLSAGFTAASANRMDGKCCRSSDGGRSYRYKVAMMRASMPRTCSAYATACIRLSRAHGDRCQMCPVAKAQCIQTGVYVGPYRGRQIAGIQMK